MSEIRIRQMPDKFDGKRWSTAPQRVRWIGSVGKWAVVRNANYPNAAPFCISLKRWEKLPVEEVA